MQSTQKEFTQMQVEMALQSHWLVQPSIQTGAHHNLVLLTNTFIKDLFLTLIQLQGCGIDLTGNCAHERSIHLYAESITSNRFVGRQCSGYQQIVTQNCPGIGSGRMGGDDVKALSGVFFIATNSVPPFAQN